ncbi:MAG: hypothetical protein NWR72_01465 [Bacteroidia bacterium]|nr:hypothetical protein [Bacteroidia bacterium]
MKILLLTSALLSFCVLTSCETATKTVLYETGEFEFVLSAPLFAGANTAQVTYVPDFQAMLAESGATPEDLHKVRLQEATFSSSDSIPFMGWEGMVLQLVSDKSPMVNAAVLNPLPANQQKITLSGSPEADITQILKDGSCYVVVDVNLTDDVMEDVTFRGTLTLALEVKE